MLWVALSGQDAICSVDEANGSVKEIISLSEPLGRSVLGARRLLLDAKRQKLYVTLSLSNEIAVWDLASAALAACIPVGVYPTGLCKLESRILVCCSESDSLWAIDASTLQPLSCVSLPGYPVGPVPCDEEAMVCSMHSGDLWRVGSDLGIREHRLLPRPAVCACASRPGEFIAALLPGSRESGALVRMNWESAGVSAMTRVGKLPSTLVSHPFYKLAALTEMQTNQVMLWSWDADMLILVDVGALPDDALWSPDGRALYISCMLDHSVYVLSPTGEVLDRWKLPGEPRGLALE